MLRGLVALLALRDGTVGEVYEAEHDRWCRTAPAPAEMKGAVVILSDGSVLFTGGECEDEPPLRWMPW
jgi:hypothetical protein